MAAFLYLPRLFVYHCQAEPGSRQSETFKVMERRLLRGIMNPSMMIAWAAGLALMVNLEAWTEGWFHVKEIGRASCRERVCQYVSISVVAVYLKKKKNKTTNNH